MTESTIHSYTNDQVILDSPHKDLRRGRSGAMNLIPTSTGAAKAVGQVIPETAGKIDGVAVRSCGRRLVDRPRGRAERNGDGGAGESCVRGCGLRLSQGLPALQRGPDRVAGHHRRPVVLRVFDAPLTQANGNFVKVFGWYDNEWGYTSRLFDLTELVAEAMNQLDGGGS